MTSNQNVALDRYQGDASYVQEGQLPTKKHLPQAFMHNKIQKAQVSSWIE